MLEQQKRPVLIRRGGSDSEPERGLAALEVMKRQAEVRDMFDRIGAAAAKHDGVTKGALRDGIAGEWTVWNRLVKAVASGLESDAVKYGRTRWPEVLQAVLLAADLRKGRETVEEDGGNILRTSLTFTQKVMVCLKRLAEEGELNLDQTESNDCRCWRFARKTLNVVGRSDEDDLERTRYLHLEMVRLMELRAAEGVALQKASLKEARELIKWLSTQAIVEGKMRVPKVGDGMNVAQMKALVASKLVGRGVEDRTLSKNTGVTARAARQIAREAEKQRRAAEASGGSDQTHRERRMAIETAEYEGRMAMAGAMGQGDVALAEWVSLCDELGVRLVGTEVRFVTAEVAEAARVAEWLCAPGGTSREALSVRVRRKDESQLQDGLLQSVRKSLALDETQVKAESFTWRGDTERIANSRGQIVMCLQVGDEVEAGRIRGLIKLAKQVCAPKAVSLSGMRAVTLEQWQMVTSAMQKKQTVRVKTSV